LNNQTADNPQKGTTIMFNSKSSFNSFAFTFGFGLLAGAAIGLLLAPMTGKKMQKKVSDISDRVIDKVDSLQQSVRKIANA